MSGDLGQLAIPGPSLLEDLAFGAEETFRMAGPDGVIRHVEARIGDSMVMIGQARG